MGEGPKALTREMGTKGSPDAMSSCFACSMVSSSSKLCTSPLLILPGASVSKPETTQLAPLHASGKK